MAYEILKSIVEAEETAVKRKEAAALEAKALKEEAEKLRTKLLEQMQQGAIELMQTATEEAIVKSRAQIQIIESETTARCEEIKEQAVKKKEEAIQAVMGKVVGTYGGC